MGAYVCGRAVEQCMLGDKVTVRLRDTHTHTHTLKR